MSGVLTVTTAAEIALAAEAAATAAAIAEAAAAAEAAATAAAALEAGSTAAAIIPEAAAVLPEVATVLPEVAGTVPEATGILEASAVPPPVEPLPPAGLEQIVPAGSTPPPPVESALSPVEPPPNIGNQLASANTGVTSDVGTNPTYEAWQKAIENKQFFQEPLSPEVLQASGNAPTPTGPQTWSDMPGQSEAFSPFDSTGPVDAPLELSSPNAPTEPNAFMQGLKSVGDYAAKHEFQTAGALYLGANALGMFKPTGAPVPEKKKYANPNPLSANFQGGPYTQPNVYKPTYPTYAGGGITQIDGPVEQMSRNVMGGQGNMYPQSQQEHTQFATPTQMPASAEVIRADYDAKTNPYSGIMMASGGVARFADEGEVVQDTDTTPRRRYRGDLMGTLDKYNEMITGNRGGASTRMPDVGIVNDTDADTRYQDAYTAALTRLKKNNKRANVDTAALPTGIQAGALNLQAQKAAGGGIMQASLGSYASGGNPRLLKGPGDGMSDNIPATIGGKQPARLADGEFVVPADVVSHLGNGSTEAGAKKLHQMMDKIRMDRTGKKKQAPAVKAGKYIPK